jgi:hypothetical protein
MASIRRHVPTCSQYDRPDVSFDKIGVKFDATVIEENFAAAAHSRLWH